MTLLLKAKGLRAAYGDAAVLFGLDLALAEGSVTVLLGANGEPQGLSFVYGRDPPRITFTGGPVATVDGDTFSVEAKIDLGLFAFSFLHSWKRTLR